MDAHSSFYLSLPDKPVYLKHQNNKKVDSIARESVLAARYSSLFIIGRSSCENHGNAGDESSKDVSYVRSCLSTQSLFMQLVQLEELSSCVEFIFGAKISQNGTSVERQLYAFPADDALEKADETIRFYAQQHGVSVWVYEKDPKIAKPSVLWRLTNRGHKGVITDTSRVAPEILEESEKVQEISPIFQEGGFSPVFHDYERAVAVLNMYKECPEVQKLFEITSEQLSDPKSVSQLELMVKQPIVVVEGMDATGKTTLTQFLETKLQAARYSTPPPCFLSLRRFFDKLPEIVRRAYYSLGNYIVAQQIASESQTRAVVMDRYWHSTAAYGIANETSFEDLPPRDHHDYVWPTDLLKPTVIIFLTVTEEERRKRLSNRQESAITFEERNLNKNQAFRKRLCEAYLRMREPACIEIDANGTEEEVMQAVLKQLELHGIQLQ